MRVICYGDSNTYGYCSGELFGSRYEADCRWVDLMAYKTGWEIINYGQNGREIPTSDKDIASVCKKVSSIPVDILIIMLGSNDLIQGAGAAGATKRMKNLLEKLDLSRDKILLIAPPPMKFGMWVTSNKLILESQEIASHYQQLAQQMGIAFADSGKWNITMTFDGVHFTEDGHKIFAEELYKFLTQKGE